MISGFSFSIRFFHARSNFFSVEYDSISLFSISLTGSHVPRAKQLFKYGFSSPYFKKVEPIKVTLSPSRRGKTLSKLFDNSFTLSSRFNVFDVNKSKIDVAITGVCELLILLNDVSSSSSSSPRSLVCIFSNIRSIIFVELSSSILHNSLKFSWYRRFIILFS